MRFLITDDIRTLSHRLGDEAILEAVPLVDTAVNADVFSFRIAMSGKGVGAI